MPKSLFAADATATDEDVAKRLRKIIDKLSKDDLQTLLISVGVHPSKRKADMVEQVRRLLIR